MVEERGDQKLGEAVEVINVLIARHISLPEHNSEMDIRSLMYSTGTSSFPVAIKPLWVGGWMRIPASSKGERFSVRLAIRNPDGKYIYHRGISMELGEKPPIQEPIIPFYMEAPDLIIGSGGNFQFEISVNSVHKASAPFEVIQLPEDELVPQSPED